MRSVTDQEIGQLIASRRNDLAMSQAQLTEELKAAGVHWSQGTLSKVENGDRPVRLSEGPALANALGIKPYQLFDRPDALRDYLIRLQFEIQDRGNEIEKLRDANLTATLAQQALSALARARDGIATTTPHDAATFLMFAFGATETPRMVAILRSLGVPMPAIEEALLGDGRPPRRSPDASTLERIAPILQQALPHISFDVAEEQKTDA